MTCEDYAKKNFGRAVDICQAMRKVVRGDIKRDCNIYHDFWYKREMERGLLGTPQDSKYHNGYAVRNYRVFSKCVYSKEQLEKLVKHAKRIEKKVRYCPAGRCKRTKQWRYKTVVTWEFPK